MFSFLPESPLGFRQVALTKIGAARATKQQGKQTCHTRFVKKNNTELCGNQGSPARSLEITQSKPRGDNVSTNL